MNFINCFLCNMLYLRLFSPLICVLIGIKLLLLQFFSVFVDYLIFTIFISWIGIVMF